MRIIAFFCLCLCLADAAELRSWTNLENQKIEGSLLRVDGENVVLKLKNGREVAYPLAKLSAQDCSYVRQSEVKPDTKPVLNFDSPWPQLVAFSKDPKIKMVEENPAQKRFIYESANYRYLCDIQLNQDVVRDFAVLFEATQLYCRTLPLAFDGGVQVDGKFQILLFEKLEDYYKAGGPVDTAGVFIGERQAVLIPLASLGVKAFGKSYMLDRSKSSTVIPHELTHQLSPEAYFAKGAMGWFSEGIAEYVATTPYQFGVFSIYSNQKEIVEYVTSYSNRDKGGRALGTKIRIPALKDFMLQDYASFQEQSQLSYGAALLLTNYFLHLDGRGDAKRLKAFLKALRDGQESEKALDVLLDGRTFEQLQNEITRAWQLKRIDFTFGKS